MIEVGGLRSAQKLGNASFCGTRRPKIFTVDTNLRFASFLAANLLSFRDLIFIAADMGEVTKAFDDQNIAAQLEQYFRQSDAQRNSLLEVCRSQQSNDCR